MYALKTSMHCKSYVNTKLHKSNLESSKEKAQTSSIDEWNHWKIKIIVQSFVILSFTCQFKAPPKTYVLWQGRARGWIEARYAPDSITRNTTKPELVHIHRHRFDISNCFKIVSNMARIVFRENYTGVSSAQTIK